MNRNALKDIFTVTFTEEDEEKIIVVVSSIVLFSVCIITGLWLNPEGCEFFSSNIPGPQMCHTIPMPKDCFSCKNIAKSYVASAIVGLGILMFLLPIMVFFIRGLSNRSDNQIKMFD